MSELIDQSELQSRAARLVEAARKAGADACDAIAVTGVSLSVDVREGKVEETVQTLIKNGYTYEEGGALWLRTTDFGDDKDRVMRKTDGGYTYFVPDVAYHMNKWQRGFDTVINEQGADHHSTITRVRAGLQALDAGIPKGWPDYVLHQMATVMRGGEEVKISKRAGSYLTLRDLIDEVGRDATRFFLAARKSDSHLNFDIDLARSESADNPVYYIQYAHARVCSIFRKLAENNQQWDETTGQDALGRLDLESEKRLTIKLGRYPEVVKRAADVREPHLIATYLYELASAQFGYDETLLPKVQAFHFKGGQGAKTGTGGHLGRP